MQGKLPRTVRMVRSVYLFCSLVQSGRMAQVTLSPMASTAGSDSRSVSKLSSPTWPQTAAVPTTKGRLNLAMAADRGRYFTSRGSVTIRPIS